MASNNFTNVVAAVAFFRAAHSALKVSSSSGETATSDRGHATIARGPQGCLPTRRVPFQEHSGDAGAGVASQRGTCRRRRAWPSSTHTAAGCTLPSLGENNVRALSRAILNGPFDAHPPRCVLPALPATHPSFWLDRRDASAAWLPRVQTISNRFVRFVPQERDGRRSQLARDTGREV